MHKCPAQGCPRAFDDMKVLKEHIARRHNSAQQEEVKLPSIRPVRLSQQKKKFEVRRTPSKGKHQQGVSASQVVGNKATRGMVGAGGVIEEGKKYLEGSETGKRRPSIGRRSTGTNEHLPDLKPVKPRKLDVLQGKAEDPMNRTAPSFHPLKLKDKHSSDVHKQVLETKPSMQQPVKPSTPDAPPAIEAFTKTMSSFQGREGKYQRPIKRHPEKAPKLKEPQVTKQPTETEATEETARSQLTKRPEPRHEGSRKIIRRDSSLKKGQNKKDLSKMYNFDERIVVLKEDISPKLTVPSGARCEFIYANKCQLTGVSLNSISCLLQLSLLNNNISDLSFLSFANCHIEKLFVDHNQITSLDCLPLSLTVLTASFNHISDLELTSQELTKTKINELDLSFNPLRKDASYKVKIVSSCERLKKLDGMKITQIDLQMADQYQKMVDEQMGLVPRKKNKQRLISGYSGSPSTEVSLGEDTALEPETDLPSLWQLEGDIKRYERLNKQTKDNLKVIVDENKAMTTEIEQLERGGEESLEDVSALYGKLKIQCEALQLLSFMQYASEEELQELIRKKEIEV